MLKRSFVLAAPAALSVFLSAAPLRADGPDEISFNLVANPRFAQCLGNDPYNLPAAKVTVSRGTANDVMVVELRNFKPGSVYDLFTTERTNLTSNGNVDSGFGGSFGLAWYQSDIHVGDDGKAEAVVKGILLDGIFGFDGDPNPGSATGAPLVAPTHTFHVGFWFDKPEDAAACGFDPSKQTPFNSVQKAGPNAMMSVPDSTTGQGPLLTVSSTGNLRAKTHCSGGMCTM